MANKSSLTSFTDQSSAIPGSTFKQRTFLGASISNCSLTAGFGDTVSTLGVNLVEDEYNVGDGTGLGEGQDPYFDTETKDQFSPPAVGSPVMFTLGPSYATVSESFRKTLDDIYGYSTISSDQDGYFDLAFGGILQAYNQNRGSDGNPLFAVQVVDPRELLSNVDLVLRNYAGSTYNTPNMFNIFGFLEYNPTTALLNQLRAAGTESILTRTEYLGGEVTYSGFDIYDFGADIKTYEESLGWIGDRTSTTVQGGFPAMFPITGTGYSRVGPQGIPYYRVVQALNALLGMNGQMPQEYIDAGFGGTINFRGFNYVVDLRGLPLVDQFYFLDYDRMSLLDFCKEICEITSHELFVSLLPVIDHPAFASFYKYNETAAPENMIFGVIRIDAIDRTSAQTPGSIKQFIESQYGDVTRSDIGVELSNVVTDKFIAGGQEVKIHLFDGSKDRQAPPQTSWTLDYALQQQILPYYGTLRSGAVTIPKGYGAYQQILLDASQLLADGVEDYYVATEMELRSAIISFETWRDFLLQYNDVYMESTELNDLEEGAALDGTPARVPFDTVALSNNYAVTVPRCAWVNPNDKYGEDGLPVDGCFPPYGYPLYYKRANRIGLNLGTLANIGSAFNSILTSAARLNGAGADEFVSVLRNEWKSIKDASKKWSKDTTQVEKDYFAFMDNLINQLQVDPLSVKKADVIGLMQEISSKLTVPTYVKTVAANRGIANAQKVYQFVKKVASDNLGKKFLVKLPRQVNTNYSPYISSQPTDSMDVLGLQVPTDYEIVSGPFGFEPQVVTSDPNATAAEAIDPYIGALVVDYNPITNEIVQNYTPEAAGGYWDYTLTKTIDPNTQTNIMIAQGLAPVDLTPVMDEGSTRVQCYVRFDNSQNLSFSKVPRDQFTQQVVNGAMWVPDANYQLDNVTEAKQGAATSIAPADPAANGPKSCAFVRADVDSKLYFAPVVEITTTKTHGQELEDIAKYSLPKRLKDCETGEVYNSIPYVVSHYVPVEPVNSGEIVQAERVQDGNGSKTQLKDFNHAYALITLPNAIQPTVDSRLRDGALQKYNTAQIKHFMGQDVVRGLPGFANPGFLGTPTDLVNELDLEPVSNDVRQSIKKARANLAFALPNNINFSHPSPVYPDLVAIPLMSSERCYGPWSSSVIGTVTNIGGNVEYEKDESLTPWNYTGYDLMNKAGLLKAQYSNSLLLQSDRGSFTIPSAPSGIALATYLTDGGPLVTQINVSIDAGASIETSYVMDMYTSSFGKLQKQKSDALAQVSRNRQKQIDDRNLNMRLGIAKRQSDSNRQEIERKLKNMSLDLEISPYDTSPGSASSTSINSTVLTVQQRKELASQMSSPDDASKQAYSNYQVMGSMNASTSAGEVAGEFGDSTQASYSFANTASSDVQDKETPTSLAPRHPRMASNQNRSLTSFNSAYGDDITPDAEWS